MVEATLASLDGALILVSYDVAGAENGKLKRHHTHPYTFRGGKLIEFKLGKGESFCDINKEFVMKQENEERGIAIDLKKFADLEEFAEVMLEVKGEMYAEELYKSDEIVLNNKFTFALYDKQRKEIYSHSFVVEGVASPKAEDGKVVKGVNSAESKAEMRKRIFRYDCRILGYHALALVVVASLVWLLAYLNDWGSFGRWFSSIVSGLYFTQLWWCNVKRSPIFSSRPLERRAKKRPWINGGLIAGVVMGIVTYMIPGTTFAISYSVGLIIAIATTAIWGGMVGYKRLDSNKEHPVVQQSRDIEKANRRASRHDAFRG